MLYQKTYNAFYQMTYNLLLKYLAIWSFDDTLPDTLKYFTCADDKKFHEADNKIFLVQTQEV